MAGALTLGSAGAAITIVGDWLAGRVAGLIFVGSGVGISAGAAGTGAGVSGVSFEGFTSGLPDGLAGLPAAVELEADTAGDGVLELGIPLPDADGAGELCAGGCILGSFVAGSAFPFVGD